MVNQRGSTGSRRAEQTDALFARPSQTIEQGADIEIGVEQVDVGAFVAPELEKRRGSPPRPPNPSSLSPTHRPHLRRQISRRFLSSGLLQILHRHPAPNVRSPKSSPKHGVLNRGA